MEWVKFFGWFLAIFSGLLLLFYAALATVWHWRMKKRDRFIQKRLDRRIW